MLSVAKGLRTTEREIWPRGVTAETRPTSNTVRHDCELMAEAASSSSPPPSHSFTPDGQYRIDGSDLGLLGAGAHGTVRIAQHVETLTCARRPARHQPNAQARAAGPRRAPLRALRTDVAVKISPISVMRSACKEMTALTRLHSQNIVQLLGVQARARARARAAAARVDARAARRPC